MEKIKLITSNELGLSYIDIYQEQIDKLQKENQLLKKQLKRQQQNFRMRYR